MPPPENAIPEETLAECVEAVPGFASFWASEGDSWYVDEDGSFASCGVFMLLCEYIKEDPERMSDGHWRALGRVARVYFDRDEACRGMIGACLIEGVQFQPFSAKVQRHFDPEVLRHFSFDR